MRLQNFYMAATMGVAFAFAINTSHANIPWSMDYSINGSTPPPFESGGIFPAFTGFALDANSTKTHPGGQYPVPSLARFDDAGALRWAVYMDAGPDASDRELQPAQSDLNHFFAGYIDEANTSVRFGMLRGTNTSMNRYSLQLPLTAAEVIQSGSVSINLESDDQAVVVRNLGSTVRALVVSSNGTTLVDKQYASPGFTANQAPLILQDAELDLIPGLNRYLLAVLVRKQFVDVISLPPVFGYSNTVVAVQLNGDGTVRWSRQFSVVTGTQTAPLHSVGPNGESAFVFVDTSFDFLTGIQSTLSRIVKLSAEGNVDWAKTVAGVSLVAPRFSSQGLWLSGTKTVTINPPQVDAVLVRLDIATGNLLAQATLDRGASDTAGIAGISQNKVFVAMSSSGASFLNQTSIVASADLTLQNFTFREYVKTPAVFGILSHDAAKDCLIYSPKALTANTVTAIALNTSLVPPADCGLFAPTTVRVQNTGLTAANLTVTATEPLLTVSDSASVLTATPLNVSGLLLNQTSLCESTGDCARPTLAIHRNAGDGTLRLEFQSTAGCTYNIQRTTTLGQSPFQTIQTMTGTGALLTFNLGVPSGNAFYRLLVNR